jgi:hypothetical protein
MVVELSEAYVLGLLADLEVDVPAIESELHKARKRASAVDAELSNIVRRLDASKAALEEAEDVASRAASRIHDHNMRIATLHQEIAGLRRRSEDLKTDMSRVEPGAAYRQLRRERAKLTIQIEDREQENDGLRRDVARERDTRQQAEEVALAERDRSRMIAGELDKLQSMLPSPHLYVDLFDRSAARAHCHMFLEKDRSAWAEELRRAIGLMAELHGELRAGKYRLDKNSEIVGGRAMASAEAIYGAVALGDNALARELFELVTDPTLFFHEIFNIFRIWCLGLYLEGRTSELRELLRLHQFAPGLRGAYGETFMGLLLSDEQRVARGIRMIIRYEWEIWQSPSLVRGFGIINLAAIALVRMARDRQMRVGVSGPTIPRELTEGARSP